MKKKDIFGLKKTKLPKNWEVMPMDHAVNIKGGSQPAKEFFINEPKEGYTRLIQIRDFKSDKYKTYIPTDKAKRIFNEDDIMIARYGPPVFQILRGLSGSYNVALMKAEPLKNIDKNYLFYLLLAPKLQGYVVANSQRTAGQSGVNLELLNNCLIPLPSLTEQKRIASILDKADELRKQRQESIDLCDKFLKALFIDMFGDYLKSNRKESLEKLVNINPKKSEIKTLDNSLEISFVPMTAVGTTGEINCSISKSIEEVKSGFTYFGEGDVLFAKITPCMENGKGCIAKGLKNKIGFGSTEFHVLRPNNLSNSQFIYTLTSLPEFRQEAANNMTGSAGQKRVPANFFKKFKLALPPMSLQNEFAGISQRIYTLKNELIGSKELLNKNFEALSQRAFKGEL